MLALWSTLNLTIAILVPLVQLIGLYCAWRALLYTRTAQGTTAWIIALLLQPFVAVPLYAVLGRRKFVGYTQARRDGDDQLSDIAAELNRQLNLGPEPVRSEATGGVAKMLAIQKMAKLPFTSGNRCELLVDGAATFDSIFEGIAAAREYVLVQFFILRDDELGERLRASLCERVRDGLRVLLLYDEIGSYSLPRTYVDELKRGGVEVSAFHSTLGRRNRFQVNFRNHRKVVLTDGHTAWIGGHNVGVEYLGEAPKFGRWRDTHLKIEGPSTLGIQLAFLEDWHWATKTVPQLHWSPARKSVGSAHALALPSGPADDLETAELFFLHMIHSAKRRVWITSPYFVPDESVVKALKLAALRGVDVRVLLPNKPDHLLIYLSSFSYLEDLCATGVRVSRYMQGFLHGKVLLVDDEFAAVGTANLDNRSFRLNFELTMLVVDMPFNAAVATMLEADFADSREMDLSHIKERSLLFCSAVKLARLAAPIQ